MNEETTSVRQQGEERDWVEEAYECFIKNATDIEPTNPVKAIEVYFEKNARDELKERAKTEGKTAATCWRFIEAVARKALHGSGHIDPTVVYAIAMHYFEDVPADWDKHAKRKEEARTKSEEVKEKKTKKSGAPKTGGEEAAKTEPTPETANEPSGTASAQRAAPARPARKPRGKTQGFFFEMMENEVKAEGEGEDGGEDAHSSADS